MMKQKRRCYYPARVKRKSARAPISEGLRRRPDQGRAAVGASLRNDSLAVMAGGRRAGDERARCSSRPH